MENRLRALFLAFILVFVPLARVVHAQRQSNDVEKTARVRSEIAKRLTNKRTRVKVKLRNGAELKGQIV